MNDGRVLEAVRDWAAGVWAELPALLGVVAVDTRGSGVSCENAGAQKASVCPGP